MKHCCVWFVIGCVFLFSGVANGQLVGDNAFLQGKYLEAAIAPNGSWGNTITSPAVYHTHTGGTVYPDPVTGTSPTNQLDFSYDAGHDGWTTGSPTGGSQCCFYGSYFLPGTPFDGWSIQMNGVRSDAYYTAFPTGFALGAGATAFTGTNVSYTHVTGSPCAPDPQGNMANLWTGSYAASGGTLAIRQMNYVDTLASWDRVNIVFKNTGATTITSLYYLVTADPDNDEMIPGSFATNNHIVYQNDAQHRVDRVQDHIKWHCHFELFQDMGQVGCISV